MAVRPIDAEKYMELLKEQYLRHKSMGNSQAAKAWQGAMQLLHDMPTLTPQNEPLSIEQLREMDGEPVYVVPANEYSELGKWCVISIGDSDDYSCALVPGVEYWSWKFDGYGEQWLAYRRPPEREEDT